MKEGDVLRPDYIIFPDASVKRSGTVCYSGYGTVILNTRTNKYVIISGELSKSSTVYCEAWAIFRGMQFVEYVRKKGQRLKILVVSDSKLNVTAFSEWIPHTWDLSDYTNWKKRDGSPVKNQKLYRMILKVINNGYYKFRIVHINSHSDKKSELRERIRKKMKSNKINISESTLSTFIQMNDLADKAANEAATNQKKCEGKFSRMVWKECEE